ncbi:MAG: nucleotidyltransferase domain-containing protein [Nanoarchaeota archaeon]
MIEKLFTSKNRVKILEFFLFREKESYIREVSRQLKITSSAVKKEIDNLIAIGILKNDKGTITLNTYCNYLEDLKNIFIKTDFLLYPLQEAFKNVTADYVFLFGSFARGDYNEQSDVDVMVIGEISSFDVYKKIKPFEDILKRDINPVVWTINNLKKEKKSGFIRDIFKKGIIMIRGDKNELAKIIR